MIMTVSADILPQCTVLGHHHCADWKVKLCFLQISSGFLWFYMTIVSWMITFPTKSVNTLRPRRNIRHFTDDIFKCIFMNENILISIKISLKFIPKGPIDNNTALVQIMAWRRPGDKPLSEPMMVRSPTHICVTWPQWVSTLRPGQDGHHFP